MSFTYGAHTSRFWMLRKHINCLDKDSLKNIPFHIWNCILISLKNKDINLVIRDPIDMERMLKYLIYRLKTHDGIKNSAVALLKKMNERSI